MRVLLLALPLLCAAAPVIAQKTYTPAQLRSMVQSGKYPAQGPVFTESREIDYATCVLSLEEAINAVKPQYPSATVVSTNLMRSEKLWTNDAAVTITCSAPDRKMIMTSAKYR